MGKSRLCGHTVLSPRMVPRMGLGFSAPSLFPAAHVLALGGRARVWAASA